MDDRQSYLNESPSSLDNYINAVTVCNSLARLTSQCSLVKYLQRITLLLKLQQCWTEDHGDVCLVCSSIKHADNKSIVSDCVDDLTATSVVDNDVNYDSSVESGLHGLNQINEQHLLEQSNISAGENEHCRWKNIEHDSQKLDKIKVEESSNGTCSSDTSLEDNDNNVLLLASDELPTTKSEVKRANTRSAAMLTIKGNASKSTVASLNKRRCCTEFDRRCTLRKSKAKSKAPKHNKKADRGRHADGAAENPSQGENKFSGCVCPFCGRQFKKPSWLQGHLVTHTGERPYACRHPGCDKRFGQSSTRNFHESSHSETRPFVCVECGYAFKSAISLKLHSRNVHASADVIAARRRHQCAACGQLFKLPGRLRQHTRHVHGDERLFACEDCTKRFKSRTQLDRHRLALHSDERPWRCSVCGKGFAQAGNMKTHMRTHTGEKPFVCTQCGCRFAHSGTLKGHMTTHKMTKDETI